MDHLDEGIAPKGDASPTAQGVCSSYRARHSRTLRHVGRGDDSGARRAWSMDAPNPRPARALLVQHLRSPVLNHRPEVTGGVPQEECVAILQIVSLPEGREKC